MGFDLHQEIFEARTAVSLTAAWCITKLLLEYSDMKGNVGKTIMANNNLDDGVPDSEEPRAHSRRIPPQRHGHLQFSPSIFAAANNDCAGGSPRMEMRSSLSVR